LSFLLTFLHSSVLHRLPPALVPCCAVLACRGSSACESSTVTTKRLLPPRMTPLADDGIPAASPPCIEQTEDRPVTHRTHYAGQGSHIRLFCYRGSNSKCDGPICLGFDRHPNLRHQAGGKGTCSSHSTDPRSPRVQVGQCLHGTCVVVSKEQVKINPLDIGDSIAFARLGSHFFSLFLSFWSLTFPCPLLNSLTDWPNPSVRSNPISRIGESAASQAQPGRRKLGS
ncbi:hypothetical protein MAPG_07505, partial [Magnaporthiopsis poae ATCC 64411]|uniref:Uncharacterized protein n=1 Tax=Magnaporthiopsis poae (strain ATCC 64411 / 73-15) TaxID=644358 RepID=A0A0C4E4V2_MAGP6